MNTLKKYKLIALAFFIGLSGGCFSSCEQDEPGNPDGNGKPYGAFTKKIFKTMKEVTDFVPAGIYQYESELYKNCLAIGTDGCYIPSTEINREWVNNWYINYADRFYKITCYDGQWLRSEVYNDPVAEKDKVDIMVVDLQWILLSFITHDDCELAPKSVSDENLFGIPVKHYMYEKTEPSVVNRTEYWITEKGVCFKKKTSSWMSGNFMGEFTYEITSADFKVGDFKSILSKLPKLQGIDTPIPAYESIFLESYIKYNSEWLTNQYARSLDS